MCPITQEPLQDPYICTTCTNSFSRDAIVQLRTCPLCRADLELGQTLMPNRTLSRVLEQGRRDMFPENELFTIFFTGSFGAGKSTAINLFVDPTRAAAPVSRVGGGARGETQSVTKVFPKGGDAGILMHRGHPIRVQVFDTPGFDDPDKKEPFLLRELSRATSQIAEGMDAIIHVVPKGRLTEPNRNLPELLLSGLAHDDANRLELAARWIFLVTKCDSGDEPATEESHIEFRGQMKSFFPPILHKNVDHAIFVENSRFASQSPWGNAELNKDKLLDQIIRTRQLYRRVYRSMELDAITKNVFEVVFARWQLASNTFSTLETHELSSLLQHFKAVIQADRFLEMTPGTTSHDAFRKTWNTMPLATQNLVAVDLANHVVTTLQEMTDARLQAQITLEVARQTEESRARRLDWNRCDVM